MKLNKSQVALVMMCVDRRLSYLESIAGTKMASPFIAKACSELEQCEAILKDMYLDAYDDREAA